MKIKLYSGNLQNFEKKSNFSTLKEFNTHIENWMLDIKSQFTKSELIALKRLIRFSAKIPGLSNAKVQTLVAATHENEIGISRRTFFRMLDKAKKFGLLIVEQTKHKSNGKQAHNIFIFQKYIQKEVVSQKTSIGTPDPITTGTPRYYQSSKAIDLNKDVKDVPYLDYTFVANFIPKSFVQLVKPFFDDADTIEKFYKKYTLALNIHNKEYGSNFSTSAMIEVCSDSFRQTIRKLKRNQVRKDKFGYFYGVLKEKLLDARIAADGIYKPEEQEECLKKVTGFY